VPIHSFTVLSGSPVVVAPTEIDVTTAEQLRVALLRAEGRQASTARAMVVVDLTRTLFCDSVGLTVLVRAHRRAVVGGGELRLVIPAKGAVARVLGLSGLDRLIPCFGSLQQALDPRPPGTTSVRVN
jgi:anti-sigma B factor antagonist